MGKWTNVTEKEYSEINLVLFKTLNLKELEIKMSFKKYYWIGVPG